MWERRFDGLTEGAAGEPTAMSMVDPNASLGMLVAQRPSRAELFERLRLDYCCGGHQTLAHACRAQGLDPDTVGRMLDALEAAPFDHQHLEQPDWRRVSIAALCDHIVAAHHDKLRSELPRVEELLATVVRVHGAQHRELHDLQRLFATIHHELEAHLTTEERILFPACRAAETAHRPVEESLLARHEDEHAATGTALTALRELANDYDAETALCRTHRRLLDALVEFEFGLHQHVHEENNILFARVRALR